MITIKNTQRRVPIDIDKVRKDSQIILDALSYHDFDLGIWFTTDQTIRRYNRDYRDKDKPTDILSFPHHPHLKAGERIKARSEEDKNLGDLIIAPDYVLRDVPRWHMTFEERIPVLLVHGICHLLGYDHIEDEEYRVMRTKEQSLLKKLGLSVKI